MKKVVIFVMTLWTTTIVTGIIQSFDRTSSLVEQDFLEMPLRELDYEQLSDFVTSHKELAALETYDFDHRCGHAQEIHKSNKIDKLCDYFQIAFFLQNIKNIEQNLQKELIYQAFSTACKFWQLHYLYLHGSSTSFNVEDLAQQFSQESGSKKLLEQSKWMLSYRNSFDKSLAFSDLKHDFYDQSTGILSSYEQEKVIHLAHLGLGCLQTKDTGTMDDTIYHMSSTCDILRRLGEYVKIVYKPCQKGLLYKVSQIGHQVWWQKYNHLLTIKKVPLYTIAHVIEHQRLLVEEGKKKEIQRRQKRIDKNFTIGLLEANVILKENCQNSVPTSFAAYQAFLRENFLKLPLFTIVHCCFEYLSPEKKHMYKDLIMQLKDYGSELQGKNQSQTDLVQQD